ncbi:hypothetical protein [Nonomuraea sp. NPDC049141]|uniref:hypothetical protein n=1 Tax=Nonomuraea sp. NPDC049141 TaxID=3155500 RepID=UPI0033C30859
MSEQSKRNRANKRKGYSWESETCKYFKGAGFAWKRNGQRHGGKDQGDIDTGDLPLAVQNKDVERISIWKTAKDAQEQADNKQVRDWVILLKRRRMPTGDGLAVLPIWLYRDMARTYYGKYLDGHPSSLRT